MTHSSFTVQRATRISYPEQGSQTREDTWHGHHESSEEEGMRDNSPQTYVLVTNMYLGPIICCMFNTYLRMKRIMDIYDDNMKLTTKVTVLGIRETK